MTTSAHLPSSPAGIDRWQRPAHRAQAVWRGMEVGAAPPRVSATRGESWGLDLRIRKRSGANADELLHLRALPANLQSIIPPRLHELLPSEVQREEVFHALGQPLAAAQRIAH